MLSAKSLLSHILVLISLYTLIFSFLIYRDKQTQYDQLSNQFYFDHILIVRGIDQKDIAELSDSVEFRVSLSLDQQTRLILKDSIKQIPTLREGNYPSDLTGPVALVGRNIFKMTPVGRNGSQWIKAIGQSFPIVGVLGADYPTSCDDLTLLYGANLDSTNLRDSVLIIDVKSERGAQRLADQLRKRNPKIQIEEGRIKGVARLTKNGFFYRLLIQEGVFILLLSTLFLSLFERRRLRNSVQIYRMEGLSLLPLFLREAINLALVHAASGGLVYLLIDRFIGDRVGQNGLILTLGALMWIGELLVIGLSFTHWTYQKEQTADLFAQDTGLS